MLTKAESKYETKVRDLARKIATSVLQLSSPVTDQQVLEVLRSQQCEPQLLCDAFWLLDNGMVRFEQYDTWHSRLRSLRNNPVVGRKMFDLFQGVTA
ncbi:hypothetical protein [Duganella vulcania]|uniref:Uncharacterized protein n=1 Tax=Duganella vulcania TaxID=2692166 RepID=A0A845GEY1_9BURK|nr:hypothetical protein [Duganella vulcania]MYM92471.1 hypothetical protein [Duganella vulcania]